MSVLVISLYFVDILTKASTSKWIDLFCNNNGSRHGGVVACGWTDNGQATAHDGVVGCRMAWFLIFLCFLSGLHS